MIVRRPCLAHGGRQSLQHTAATGWRQHAAARTDTRTSSAQGRGGAMCGRAVVGMDHTGRHIPASDAGQARSTLYAVCQGGPHIQVCDAKQSRTPGAVDRCALQSPHPSHSPVHTQPLQGFTAVPRDPSDGITTPCHSCSCQYHGLGLMEVQCELPMHRLWEPAAPHARRIACAAGARALRMRQCDAQRQPCALCGTCRIDVRR